MERIRTLSTWPIELALLTRIVGYVILPPCAWVAAARVESLVDRL